MQKQTLIVVSSIVLAVVFSLAALSYNTQKIEEVDASAQQNASVLVRDYSPTMGNKDAKVTIVEFFDPACGTCKAFYPFVKHLMASNPDKIKLVLRYIPLHQGSDEIIKILEAARLQNKLWKTLEVAYETQSSWAVHHIAHPQKLWMILENTTLDIEKAKQDIQSPVIAQRIQQDMADARELLVEKTPGFFVNGKPLVNFGYQQLQTLVETEIHNNY